MNGQDLIKIIIEATVFAITTTILGVIGSALRSLYTSVRPKAKNPVSKSFRPVLKAILFFAMSVANLAWNILDKGPVTRFAVLNIFMALIFFIFALAYLGWESSGYSNRRKLSKSIAPPSEPPR